MDVEFLSRLQFAITICFHFIFPPMTIGLGILLVIMEAKYLLTSEERYYKLLKFWTSIFSLIFLMGVVTGLVMEFEFGTNWAVFSKFAGEVFGSPLVAEGIFAFFLESVFLGIVLFGWKKVSPGIHFFSTCMVALGSMLSSVWILAANSWMQTPAGFRLTGEGALRKAEITDFWAMVFNPSFINSLFHTMTASVLTGAFLVMGISAYFILKKKDLDVSEYTLKLSLFIALGASMLQLVAGDISSKGVSVNQPAKMAAFEGHIDSSKPGDLQLFGWFDDESQTLSFNLQLPGFLSFLLFRDFKKPVRGLDSFAKEDLPPVNLVFQAYHLMIFCGLAMLGLCFLAIFFLFRGRLFNNRRILGLLVPSLVLPQLANQTGWISAEVGRQPWIIYGVMKTREAFSQNISSGEVLFSIIFFTLIYILLSGLFVFLFREKLKKGISGV